MLHLSAASQVRLNQAHPLLIKLFTAVATERPILVMDSQRGRAAQEEAFRTHHSNAHFGQSAHNWSPAIALDVAPEPLNWDDLDSFRHLATFVLTKAHELSVPITWGGGWNKLKDMPHYELSPWRSFAAKAKPFGG